MKRKWKPLGENKKIKIPEGNLRIVLLQLRKLVQNLNALRIPSTLKQRGSLLRQRRSDGKSTVLLHRPIATGRRWIPPVHSQIWEPRSDPKSKQPGAQSWGWR